MLDDAPETLRFLPKGCRLLCLVLRVEGSYHEQGVLGVIPTGMNVDGAGRGVLAAWAILTFRKADAVHTLWRRRSSPRDVIGLETARSIFFTNTA